MQHFDPDLDPEVRLARERFIEHREKQLQSVATTASENAIKYLFTINAGGAVAVLTYLGAIASNHTEKLPLKYSLAFFFVGLVLVGLYKALLVHIYTNTFKMFQNSLKSYFKQQREWDDFYQEIESHVKQNNMPYILGYSSFACFFLGSVFGTLGLLQ